MPNENQIIVQLDKKTINKIAAGEVVERPASVVKELVENSIDAGATEISVLIKDYGLEEIRIMDNGIGMSREDASLAWKSHTTSKLKSIDDLESIYSLGFRGEALASIASVSMMEILTKQKDQITGTVVRIKGGELELVEERECAPGTTISVKNLFYNVPARKKFLKSKTTELGHIIEIVTRQALIRPNIHFKLQHEAAVLLNSPRTSNSLEPFIAVFGADQAKKMMPIEFERDGIKLIGYTSQPDYSRATRDHEMFYVNNRYVKSRLLSEAVEEAYKTLLMTGRYPVILVNIEVDSAKVDVNIHPTKREIRFDNATLVFAVVKEAIAEALTNRDLWRETKTIVDGQKPEDTMQTSLKFESVKQELSITTQKPIIVETKEVQKSEDWETADTELTFEHEGLIQPSTRVVKFSDTFWLKPIGQLLKLYALCESNEGLAIMDIHAAHERVRYEELLKKYDESTIEVQELLHPITISLNPEQMAFIKEYHEQFRALKFDPEVFGGNTYIIRSLPVIMDIAQTEADIRNLIDEIRVEIPKLTTLNERIDLMIKKMACHSVVRGGDLVTLTKIVTILRELSTCKTPYTCPHGRPTIIKISAKQLEKEFGRIV